MVHRAELRCFRGMEQLEKAKKKRRTHRGTAKRLLNKVESLVKEDNVDRIKLKQCSIDLSEKQKVLKEIDATIIEMMIENDYEDEDCDRKAEEAIKMGERITYNLVLIENALNDIKKDVPAQQSGSERGDDAIPSANLESMERRESIMSVQLSSQPSRSLAWRMKLPKLELKRQLNGKNFGIVTRKSSVMIQTSTKRANLSTFGAT